MSWRLWKHGGDGSRGVLAPVLSALLIGVACMASGGTSDAQRHRSPLGINLHKVRNYSPELIFTDVFRMSSRWVSNARGVKWGKAGPLAVNDRGWVTSLRPGQWAEAPLLTGMVGRVPTGVFTCLYEGKGTIEFEGGTILASRPGRLQVRFSPGARRFSLKLTSTDPEDPIRDIRLISPGFEETHRDQPFDPGFLERWRMFSVLRFMDWMQTNDSEISAWTDRPRPDDWAQGTSRGVALETMIELANAAGADPWFCMPHLATDDYVRSFARTVAGSLAPHLKVYVEYSNEVWNGHFEQAKYARSRGMALELAGRPASAGLRYTSRRSVEIFDIFEEAFGGTERLVRVMAGQFASPQKGRALLSWGNASQKVDAYAVAPYFGGRLVRTQGERLLLAGLDPLFEELREEVGQGTARMREHAQLASEFGVALIAYEGGQHLRPARRSDPQLTRMLTAANRDPRMAELYARHLANWKAAGGQVFVHFSSMSKPGSTGMWGALETPDQKLSEAPKYRALLEFIDAHPRWW